MYRIEIVFRYNQDDTLPDCIEDAHRVANTDYFEIIAGTFSDKSFAEVYSYLCDTKKDNELVSYYFEVLDRKWGIPDEKKGMA